MPTFDMLCAESIADAVLGRDGDVARRLRAETGASVELLAPPPHGTSLFAFEPADALVARRVPPDRDVAVRVSCDDALSTAFSCPAQTCLFRLHARLAAFARDDEADAAGARRDDRASRPARGETTARKKTFFRVLAPRGACDVQSVRERTGASVRVVPYDARANTDLVVVDRHENCESCHVEAMRRVVARLGEVQAGRRENADRARLASASLRCGGRLFPPHRPPVPANDKNAPRNDPEPGERSAARAASFPAYSRYAGRTGVPSERARDVLRDVASRDPAFASGPRTADVFASVATPRDERPMHRPMRRPTTVATAVTTTTVTLLPIPTSLVSAVVGRGGATIQRVRTESGAKVKLHDCAPGAATRFLELGGERAKVQAARALVVQCLERIFTENPEQDEPE